MMKPWWQNWRRSWWLLPLAAAVGCVEQTPRLSGVGRSGFVHPPKPPEFLAGSAGFLLTNAPGFSARVTLDLPGVVDGTKHVTGTLLGREGHFLYSADKENSFIWFVTSHVGFILNEPLQAYAPMTEDPHVTNLVTTAIAPGTESVNGHPCKKSDLTVYLGDGATDLLTVWRATDLGDLPVRIVSSAGPARYTANLENVRLEQPRLGLFVPPEGFSKYATAEALMTELVSRNATVRGVKRDSGRGPDDLPPGSPGTSHRGVGGP